MSQRYIVVIKETWIYHIRIDANTPEEAIEKVDGGRLGEYVKVDRYTDSCTATKEEN